MNSILRRADVLLSCRKLPRPNAVILRKASYLEKLRSKPILLDKTNHKVIYEFKYIVLPAGALKMKKIMPIISVPLIGVCIYLSLPGMAVAIMAGCCLQMIIIIALSRFSKNMIGKIYINKEGEIKDVIISSIDVNGTRIDESFSPSEISLSPGGLSQFLGFAYLSTGNPEKMYIMNFKNGKIHDLEAMKTVIADILSYCHVKNIKKKK